MVRTITITTKARRWLLLAAGVFAVLVLAAMFAASRMEPAARAYVVNALRERYESDVELGSLHFSLFPTVKATGETLVLRFHGRRDVPPMIRIRRFTVHARFSAVMRTPRHISRVVLEGLEITLPPKKAATKKNEGSGPKASFILDEVVADGTQLKTLPKDSSKDPLVFEIRKLTLNKAGVGEALKFRAELINAKPPGLINTEGQFGPWHADEPSDTPLSGHYTFRDADLSVFKGIRGKLSSKGEFGGVLDTIEVHGTTDVPDFALKLAEHPMHLYTDFQATVDGTNGNTVLHPVRARLGKSSFEVSGAIDRGALEKKKTILLLAKSGGSRLEDFLRLSVKSARPPMTGAIRFSSTVKIPPGDNDVIDRLDLDGEFGLGSVKFTSPDVESKISSLSHRAQGQPEGHDDVAAAFSGHFRLDDGLMRLPDLKFNVPGAAISLAGSYHLRSGALDFTGTARTEATISKMTTGFKSVLLKPVDPLFKRDGSGAVLPINISGTRGQPSFSLDIGRVLKRK